MRKTTIIKDKNFGNESLHLGKDKLDELVIMKNCTFDLTRIYTYSGKIRFYDCLFENKSKIIDLTTPNDQNENLIELIRMSTKTSGQNLEVIAPQIRINLPVSDLRGIILYADRITINGGNKEINVASIAYSKNILINDTLINDSVLSNTDNATETFSNCYINNVFHPLEMLELEQKKLK